ncbi:MAG: ABC transporter ATP-binding protein [Candidatus Heimdallarchaeota archaeon]
MDPLRYINIEGLTKDFGKIRALNEVSLYIKQGETFGLVGPNGAGKTTLVRILSGLLSPTSGRAAVGGFDVISARREVKRITGLLPERPGTYEDLTAREFLQFIAELYNVPRKKIRKRTDQLLTLFDLMDRGNDLIAGYSAGMRQRLMLASTIVHDPPVLFLDEPTSSLDPAAARMVKDLIDQLAEEAGRTIFISSHQLPLIEEVSDRIAILHEGNLMAHGTLNDLLSKTGTQKLEEAFFTVTGLKKRDAEVLLSWRGE